MPENGYLIQPHASSPHLGEAHHITELGFILVVIGLVLVYFGYRCRKK